MKKVISTILALVMVLAVCAAIPMTASADTTYNTSRYYNNESTSGLDAYAGTPTMGAAADAKTIKEAVWDNALKFTLNGSTNDFLVDNNTGDSANADFYMLWDKDNLYILQDVKAYNIVSDGKTDQKTTGSPYPYSGHEVNVFNILLPRDFSTAPTGLSAEAYYSNTDTAKSYMIFVMPCLDNPEVTGKADGVNTGDIYEGVVRVRSVGFLNPNSDTGGKYVVPYDTTYNAGLRTYIEKTDAGYISETVVPWSFLDSTATDEFAKLTAAEKVGKTFGVKINHKGSYIMNAYGMSIEGNFRNNDTAGFDPVTLYNEKEDLIQNEVPTADYNYWLNSTTGQFITKNPKNGGQTYEISTAGQLLALSGILETLAHNETTYGLNSLNLGSNDNKALITKGNTFVLTNDIDLNPGVDCRNYEIAKYAKVPVAFQGLDAFYGVIDGQGHTISGILNLTDVGTNNGNDVTADAGGLIGRIGQGGVKNLILDNGYISDGNGGGFGGVFGTVYATNHTDVGDGAEIFLKNVYVGSNYYVRASHKIKTANNSFSAYDGSCGGIFAAEWANNSGSKTVDVDFKNVVFNGHLINGGNKEVGLFGYRLNKTVGSTTTYNLSLTDCLVYDNENAGLNLFKSTLNSSYVLTRSTVVAKNSEIPAANAGNWVALTDGTVAPVKVADMLDTVRWQATVVESGRFNVRFVSEVDASNFANYDSVGHIVTITATKGTETKTSTVDFSDNTTVYKSVIANGVTIDANNAEKFGVIDGTHLVASVINLPDIDGVVYTASVKTVYKIGTTTIEGVAHDLGAIAPLN